MLGFAGLGVDVLSEGYGKGVASGFQSLILARNGAGAYLIEISAYAGGETYLGGGPLLGAGVLGETGLGDSRPFDGTSSGGLISLLVSDVGWTGTPTDAAKANVHYEARLLNPLSIERAIPIVPEQSPRIQRQLGEIELDNTDGAYDNAITGWAVDGREIPVYFGPKTGDFADFDLVAKPLGVRWEVDEGRARISVRDRRYALEKPIQTDLYEGTGGAEGPADLEGKPRPICYGKNRNISPALVDSANLIYEFHYKEAKAVDDVYDQGLALTDSTDNVADFTTLQSHSVAAGEFAISLSSDGSYIKLGSSPSGLITADVRGDNTDSNYVDTIDAVCLRILRTEGGLGDGQINSGSWAGLVAAAGTLGIYLDQLQVRSTAIVIDALVKSVGGFWGTGKDGRLRSGRLTNPADSAPVFYFQEADVLDLLPDSTPTPRYRQRIGYQRRWVVQTSDIAGAVTDARKQFLAEPYSVVTAIDTTVQIRHLEALDPDPLISFYDEQANAQTLADTLLALHKVDRRQFSIVVKRLGYLLELGDAVSVTHSRLGSKSGSPFRIVRIRNDASRDEQTITLWG